MGLGREFALQCASKRLNVVLIDIADMEETATAIKKQSPDSKVLTLGLTYFNFTLGCTTTRRLDRSKVFRFD